MSALATTSVSPGFLLFLQITGFVTAVITFAVPITAFLPSIRAWLRCSCSPGGGGDHEQPALVRVEMPPLSITAQVCSAGLWWAYSVLLNDLSFMLPCVQGHFCGLLFLALYWKFHKSEVYGRELRLYGVRM